MGDQVFFLPFAAGISKTVSVYSISGCALFFYGLILGKGFSQREGIMGSSPSESRSFLSFCCIFAFIRVPSAQIC